MGDSRIVRRRRNPRWRGAPLPLLAAISLAVACSGCGGLPIHWERWDLPDVDPNSAAALRERVRVWERQLYEHHISEEGLLLYRAPSSPHPETGLRMDLADQSCWSGYLLAGLAMKSVCEPEPGDEERLRKVVAGIRLLHDVTGTPGLIARCVVPREMADALARHPEYWGIDARAEPYAYRGNPSKDQYAGYIFGLTAAAVLVDDEAVRRPCIEILENIARHLHDGDLRIRDGDGTVTRFGDLRGRIFGIPIGVNSAIALSLFTSVAALTTDEKLRSVAQERMKSLRRTLEPLHFELFGIRNYNNDLMAAAGLVAITLCPASRDDRRLMREVTLRFLENFRGEGNAFFVSLGALAGVRDSADETWALRNFINAPIDLGIREVDGSYGGVPRRWVPDRKGRSRSTEALPLAVRSPSSFVWRSDPYVLDPKEGARSEFRVSGVDYVCAYWLGRFAGWIPPQ